MSRYVFKLPDLGEGNVSSEIVAWRVKVGDEVAEDQPVVEMSTDKAVVEVPAPVAGRVVALAGQPGDIVMVGAELIVFETASTETAEPLPTPSTGASTAAASMPSPAAVGFGTCTNRVLTSPAVRRRAREAGIDVTVVRGTGPGGRILPRDLSVALQTHTKCAREEDSLSAEAFAGSPEEVPGMPEGPGIAAAGEMPEEVKVVGPRRVIAQRMSAAKRDIPHFSYVEEVDVTELDALRQHLNATQFDGAPFTYLPFLIAALVRVLESFPQCNAHYDSERGVLLRHRSVHVGIATQTPDGLVVPVLRRAEKRSLGELSREIRRLSEAARSRTARREELTGSTITVTSLGKLGGIVSTPILNPPEVAIIGVNRAVERPVVRNGAIVIRRMMNVSSSFDHRFVDGYDAAAMIQALKTRLEHPAATFMRT